MNEVSQQIKFIKSRLNWDADIPVMGEGESKYFLNQVPEDSEHIGARTNCLGNTLVNTVLNAPSPTPLPVTETLFTNLVQFSFTITTLPEYLWVEILLRGELKHIFIPSAGYGTTTLFAAHVVDEVHKYLANELYQYQSITNSCVFVFEQFTLGDIEIIVRTGSATTYPANLKVIGSYYDKLNNIVYFWVHDRVNHAKFLYQYYRYNDVIVELAIGDHDVTGEAQVLNAFTIGTAKDTMLYWNYSNGIAHKINVYNVLTNAITETAFSTNILKPAPFVNPTVSSLTSSTDYNNYDKWFQVLIRSKFDDNELSVFGGLSSLLYPYYMSENSIGAHGNKSSKEHYVTYANNTHPEWTNYEYAVRTNDGNWQLATLRDAGAGSREVTGSEPLYTVAPSDISRLFDFVPQSVGALSVAGNNRLLLAYCKEGYPNIDISNTSSVGSYISPTTLVSAYIDETPAGGSATFTMEGVSAAFHASHVVYIKTATDEYYVPVLDDSGMTSTQVATYMKNYINLHLVGRDAAIQAATSTGAALTIVGTASLQLSRYMWLRAYQKYLTFPSYTNLYFGMVYYDQHGRCGGVNIGDGLTVASSNYEPAAVTLSISNQPPEWAYYYRLFYGGSDKSWYQQLGIRDDDVQHDPTEKQMKLFLNNVIVDGQVINPAFNIGSYVWNKGDRVRFLKYASTGVVGYASYTVGNNFTTAIDLEILSQDDVCIYLPEITNAAVLTQMQSASYYLIEIYTPASAKPVEYFETIYWGAVTNPGTSTCYHGSCNNSGSTQAQTAIQDLEIEAYGFDHLIYQTFFIDEGKPISFWTKSESFSNYFPSKTKGLGRVNFYSPDFNTLRRNIVRASNIYIPQTDINGLSTFEYANEVTIDESYGNVTDIKLVGDVLKIIQPHKISSIYLGAEIGTDAGGNQMMLSSDKILTNPRYNALDLGSLHPESVVVHNQYLYALDVINSVVWRDTPGGTFPISDNGMRSYFKYKIRQLMDSCGQGFRAYGAYDYLNEIYLLTFKDPYNSANNETVGFHEPSESWYSFYSFLPEMYCGISGDYLLSFYNGKLYVHSSATRNNFYTTQYTSKSWVVANQYPDDVKKWNSLSVNSNDIWGATDGILVDADMIVHQDPLNYTSHKGAMESALKEANFRFYNGEYRAEFLRDGKTTSSVLLTTDLINGRPLVGKTILIKLSNDNTSAVYLRGVRVNASIAR